MIGIDNDLLLKIEGGSSISATLVNALTNTVKFLFDVGHHLGSAIRRIASSNVCPLP